MKKYLNDQKYMGHFHKSNNTGYQDALIKEAEGLNSLKQVLESNDIKIKIPAVFQVDEQVLETEHINQLAGAKQQWFDLGASLARFHTVQQKSFGWSANNYIGLNPQQNVWSDDWGRFFWQHRLGYQIQLIRDPNIQSNFAKAWHDCKTKLVAFLNKHCNHASLLHGDLWNGNVLFDNQDAWLIDPAVYCGDAEADVAMTELFGGFPAAFYQGYQSTQPLSEHYPLKKVIYNLYHLLNHYNLFGSGYLAGCERGFRTIEQSLK